jgi:hypothetical protein
MIDYLSYLCVSKFSSQGDSPSPVFYSPKWTHFRYGAQSRLDGRRTSVTDHPFNLTANLPHCGLVRCACATRLISRMTSSRSGYHCSSLWRPALQRLPHFLSSTSMDGLPCKPTVHLRQSASTVLTAPHIRCFGDSSRSCSRYCCCCPLGPGPCSGGLGERACGVATMLAWADVYSLDNAVGGSGGSGGS